ncbi:hypothetical protein ANN_20123 [Periplaneta americana]|uniref:Uncharacterized protein n=1 Tax=Periplaneta americana TaxID=6978 RepID=A0ABQ8SCE8_PERAM|nr:hypothetical protein ANN_20123 [Periplaneta americana]
MADLSEGGNEPLSSLKAKIHKRLEKTREFYWKQRRITYVPEKLPSKYGVHSEEYLRIRMVTRVVGAWHVRRNIDSGCHTGIRDGEEIQSTHENKVAVATPPYITVFRRRLRNADSEQVLFR